MAISRRLYPTRFGPRSSALERGQRRAARYCCIPRRARERCGSGCRSGSPARRTRRTAWVTDSPMRLRGPSRSSNTRSARRTPSRAAAVQGPFDVLGVHVGSIEAIEIAHHLPHRVRRLIAVGMPLFTAEEQQRHMEKYSEQPLKPAAEGGHVLGAWRGCFAFRQPPYDLADTHRRFVEHLLAANPGAAFRAASSYPIEKKLKSPAHAADRIRAARRAHEQTQRVKPMLKADAVYVDLPDLAWIYSTRSTDRMAELINRHLPP